MKLGVLGGTFDPVHTGHLILGETAREELDLDTVLFVPTGYSWRKPDRKITRGADRLAMLRLAIAGNPGFDVSSIEVEREGASYTDETLEQLKSERPDADLFFILGRDALADLPNWKAPERIVELATLVVAERPRTGGPRALEELLPGLSARIVELPMPQLEVTSSDVRTRVMAGRSIRYLVPDAVREYIHREGMYSG